MGGHSHWSTIKRGIERGEGGGDAAALVETTFEGYGPGGVAIIMQALTDNRNRTVSEIRTTLSRNGGSLGESGSVAWQFDSVGFIDLDVGDGDPEEVALAAIDAGAEDVRTEDGRLEVYTAPTELIKVRKALEEAGLSVSTAELSMLPKNTLALDESSAAQVLRLLDILEDLDDVQKVYSNADFPESVLMEYAAAQ